MSTPRSTPVVLALSWGDGARIVDALRALRASPAWETHLDDLDRAALDRFDATLAGALNGATTAHHEALAAVRGEG